MIVGSELRFVTLVATVVIAIGPGCFNRSPSGAGRTAGPASKEGPTDQAPLYVPPPKQEKPFVLELAPGVTMEFVWIPPGSFTMGDPKEGIPRHKETISRPFYLAKTEVTQQQWTVVLGKDKNPSLLKGAQYPVHRVNWEDCQAFIKALNEKYVHTGMRFSLPTEVEWEYACRAGHAVKLDTPDDPAKIEEYAWLGSNSQYEPHPVAQKKPNAWGLFDMQGNVAEWCADELRPGPDGRIPGLPPEAQEPSSNEPWYVVRGGNYREGPAACTSTSRYIRRAFVPLRHDGLRPMCVPR